MKTILLTIAILLCAATAQAQYHYSYQYGPNGYSYQYQYRQQQTLPGMPSWWRPYYGRGRYHRGHYGPYGGIERELRYLNDNLWLHRPIDY